MQSCSSSGRHRTSTAGQAPCSTANPAQNSPAAEINSFHLSPSLPAVSGCLPGWKLLSSRFRAGVWHCQHLHHGDAGSVPLCLDFQVGESSGPICSSPSLIIPVVIIPLNSRQLEGKKISHLSTAREQEVQGVRGEQQGQAVLRVLPSLSLQTRLQCVHSSVPALPVLPGWEMLHTP